MDADVDRILITGAQGFLGRHLSAWLAHMHPSAQILGVGRSVLLQDSFTHVVHWAGRPVRAPLPLTLRQRGARIRYVRADVRNRHALSRVVRDFRPQLVFHLASALRDDPPDALFASILGTVHLIEAVAQPQSRPRMTVIVSSGGVYGQLGDTGVALREDAPCLPADLYTTSKLAAEYSARVLAVHHRVPLVVARVFNVIGPGQDERHVCGRLASQIAAIMRGGAAPEITLDDVSTTRDFIDVRDVVRALTTIARAGRPGLVANVGSGFLRLGDLEGRVTVPARRPAHAAVRRQRADVSRLGSMDFRCEFSLRRSCQDLLTYYLTDVADRARAAEKLGA